MWGAEDKPPHPIRPYLQPLYEGGFFLFTDEGGAVVPDQDVVIDGKGNLTGCIPQINR